MNTYEYLIVVHSDDVDGGFWTEVPALPGCGSQGETVEEAVAMTKDAIEGFLASMRKHGETPPVDTTETRKVIVAA